jgi:ribosome-binding factor A
VNLVRAGTVRRGMPPRRPPRTRLRTLCAEVSPEDGTDPRDWLKGLRGTKPDRRKARQLCAQVAEALTLLLAAEPDNVLRDLDVVAVEPSPDTKQLLVTVRALPGTAADTAAILDALARASGRLRAEVASAITRRRAPLLIYRVMTEGTGSE